MDKLNSQVLTNWLLNHKADMCLKMPNSTCPRTSIQRYPELHSRGKEEAKILIVDFNGYASSKRNNEFFTLGPKQRLCGWLGISETELYNSPKIAIFSFKDKSCCIRNKIKKRPFYYTCWDAWKIKIAELLPNLALTIPIGERSISQCLGHRMESNVLKTIQNRSQYLPEFFPLPHPHGNFARWPATDSFEEMVVPEIQRMVKRLL